MSEQETLWRCPIFIFVHFFNSQAIMDIYNLQTVRLIIIFYMRLKNRSENFLLLAKWAGKNRARA